jgi:cytochrome oxidase assembly protein ShyY1
LRQFDDNEDVLVGVRTHTQKYAVANVAPFEVSHGAAVMIWISLPDNMHTVERKK